MIIKNIVSIPRSGQHFTERALKFYHTAMNLKYNYCEFYHCCQSRPCKKNKNSFQKNHDWELDFEINDKDKYLFLYRTNKVQQIEANFRLHLKNKNIISTSNVKIDYTDSKMLRQLKKYILDRKKYYKGIYKKYLSNNQKNILKIEYDTYILNFCDTFKKILLFFDVPIDETMIIKTFHYIKPTLVFKIDQNDSYYTLIENFIQRNIEL